MAYPLNGEERLRILYETFNPDSTVDFQFDYGSMIKTGLNTKDYVAPTSFVFKDGKTFQMGNTMGAVSYLQILAPELTDNIARRTVAKYREQLGLPVARLRKG